MSPIPSIPPAGTLSRTLRPSRKPIVARTAGWRWVLCLCLVLGLSHPAWAEPKDGQTFKDWIIRCGKAVESAPAEPCVMSQSLVVKEGEKRIMQVVVGMLKKDRKAVVVITVPLGVRLPPGLRLRIDQTEEIRIPYQQCIQGGCRGRLELSEQLEVAFRAGLQAKATFVSAAGRDIGLQISLKGFTAALNSLR